MREKKSKKIWLNLSDKDYWFKVVDFLQVNWAAILPTQDGQVEILFFHELSGIFDKIEYQDSKIAAEKLRKNGFSLACEEHDGDYWLKGAPRDPFYQDEHPNGPIYSSGRFWK